MQKDDDHFSVAQMEAVDRRGLSAEQVSWRRVSMATLPPVSFSEDAELPPLVDYRRPRCPIVDRCSGDELIVLPDGTEQWVQ